jgi:hypothetical protein
MVDRLLTANADNPQVGYVAAYGNHMLSAAEQRAAAGSLIMMQHNWGFGLYRRQWLAMQPHMQQYLDLVRNDNYRRRDHAAIRALYASWGFGIASTSQDTAKSLACCLTRSVKINTAACFASYIGEYGLHMEPNLFDRAGFARTVVYDGPIPDIAPVDDAVFHALRAAMLAWAGKPKGHSESTRYSEPVERKFRRASTLAGERKPEQAVAQAQDAVADLFNAGPDLLVTVQFQPRAAIPEAERVSTIRIEAVPGKLAVLCPREMVSAQFTDYYNALVLAGDIVSSALAATPGAAGEFTMELGACTRAARPRCVAFSAPVAHQPVIFDGEFYASVGYAQLREAVRRGWIPWRDRRDVVFWRGNTAGVRRHAPVLGDDGAMQGWDWLQRLHFCALVCALASKSAYADRLDVGITRLLQMPEAPVRAAIEASGFMRPPVQQADLMLYRHVCVLDANASAGNGLFPAMLSGACILLVASPLGLRNWLGDALVDWQTHVPVAADLSDLEEKLTWIFANPDACEKIAARAFALACHRRFETEKASAVQAVVELLC